MVLRLLRSLSLLNYFSLLQEGEESGLFCVRLFRPLWPPNLGGSSCGSDPQPPNLGGEGKGRENYITG